MMLDEPLKMSFPGASVGEANQLAASLRESIQDAHSDVRAERQRENPESMDFGTTLGVLLTPEAVSALARVIAAWLSRNRGVRLEIQQPDDSVAVLTNIDSRDVPRIMQALTKQRK